jgi:uncharacterized membrane protein YphA (DoxX/SURF4 family)
MSRGIQLFEWANIYFKSWGAMMISRFLIALFFLIFGVLNLRARKAIIPAMIEKNIPFAGFVFYLGVLYEVFFGIAMACDFYTSFAALSLILFVVIAICIFHPFWTMSGELRLLNQIIFITNSTIVIGALLGLIDWTQISEGLGWLKSIR